MSSTKDRIGLVIPVTNEMINDCPSALEFMSFLVWGLQCTLTAAAFDEEWGGPEDELSLIETGRIVKWDMPILEEDDCD